MNLSELQRLTKHIHYLPANNEVDRPILGVISGNEKTLLMDAGNSPAHASLLLDQVASLDIPTPAFLALTHWHWDHVFGMDRINLPTIAHRETHSALSRLIGLEWTDEALDQRVKEGTEIEFCATYIKKEYESGLRNQIQVKLPHILFDTLVEVDLGGITCVIEHVGGDHASDSSVVYVKEEKILFLGDCLGSEIYCEERNYVPENFLALLEKIDRYDAEWYIESHWKPLSRQQFQNEMAEMREVAQLTLSTKGNREAIIRGFTEKFSREVTKDDCTVIDYFITGLLKRS